MCVRACGSFVGVSPLVALCFDIKFGVHFFVTVRGASLSSLTLSVLVVYSTVTGQYLEHSSTVVRTRSSYSTHDTRGPTAE